MNHERARSVQRGPRNRTDRGFCAHEYIYRESTNIILFPDKFARPLPPTAPATTKSRYGEQIRSIDYIISRTRRIVVARSPARSLASLPPARPAGPTRPSPRYTALAGGYAGNERKKEAGEPAAAAAAATGTEQQRRSVAQNTDESEARAFTTSLTDYLSHPCSLHRSPPTIKYNIPIININYLKTNYGIQCFCIVFYSAQ